jgi:hypothetical protein
MLWREIYDFARTDRESRCMNYLTQVNQTREVVGGNRLFRRWYTDRYGNRHGIYVVLAPDADRVITVWREP